MIRVVIVDDHDLLRWSLIQLIASEADLLMVGEAEDGEEAVRVAAQTHPDVILMDLHMPRLNGIDATRQIKAANADVRILMFSIELDEKQHQAALDAGAERFLVKPISADQMLAAIHDAG